MKSDEFSRALVRGLYENPMPGDVQREILRCVAIVHPDNPFVLANARRLLARFAKRSGQRRNPAIQDRIVTAAAFVRFNKSIGLEAATEKEAARFGLTFAQVDRAVKGKDAHVRIRVRKRYEKIARNNKGRTPSKNSDFVQAPKPRS